MSSSKGYRDTGGVDTGAADRWVDLLQSSGVAATREQHELRKRLISGIGDYAAVFAQTADHWVAASCDGVGTKLLWTLEGLGTPEGLAQDLLAMNVNDLLCVGARPTLFLDYLAVGSKSLLEKDGLLAGFIRGLNKLCAETGQLLVGGETAQMPDLYSGKHFDLAGFSIGFLSPAEHLTIENINMGQKVWAWPSSGPHSNGYSWLRKIFDAEKDADLIKKQLMAPTRLYVNEFLAFRDGLKNQGQGEALKAAFHITGSGLLNFLRAQPRGRTIGFEFDSWDIEKSAPVWMRSLKERSESSWEDLLCSFNGGVGFAMVLDAAFSDQQSDWLKGQGLIQLGLVNDSGVLKMPGLKTLS